MDFDKVNNPFITLKNHKTHEEFTVDLSKNVPNIANDQNMSNMKKSDHALYSDQRADKLKWGDEIKTIGKYSITLIDIDNIIYEYFTKIINPTVTDTNSTKIKVPVRHASPERWSSIQNDGVYRDDKGQLQRPIIIFTRSNVARDDSFVTFNKYLSVPFVKKFSNKNSYDKLSVLNNAHPMHEVHNVTFPDHVVLTYEFTMNTEYVQQMNQLIETINFAENDYWGDPAQFKFRASVDSFSNTVETPSDDDRSVSSTFTLTVNAYLLPLIFNNQTNVKRGITTRKAIFGTEALDLGAKNPVYSKKELLLDAKKREISSTKNLLLNRKIPTAFIRKEDSDTFIIRIWKDLEEYKVSIEGKIFKMELNYDTDEWTWDIDGENRILKIDEEFSVSIESEFIPKLTLKNNEMLFVTFVS